MTSSLGLWRKGTDVRYPWIILVNMWCALQGWISKQGKIMEHRNNCGYLIPGAKAIHPAAIVINAHAPDCLISRRIWEIHSEYTCFLRLQLLAKIGYIPQFKRKNAKGLYEISFPLTRMPGCRPNKSTIHSAAGLIRTTIYPAAG